MLVKLNEISESGSESEREFSSEDLNEIFSGDMPTRFSARASVKVRTVMYRAGLDVVVEAEGNLPLIAGCSSCLQDFDLDMPVSFRMTLQPAPAQVGELPEEMGLSEEEVRRVYYTGNSIDLGNLLREQILLSVPMFPRCAKDCKGLCSSCGCNLNLETCTCESRVVDPRFAVLKNLKA